MTNSSALSHKLVIGPNQAIPRVRDRPIIGSLWRLARDQFDALLAFQREQGDLFELDLGVLRLILVCHPQLAHEVLVQHNRVFGRGGMFYEPVQALVGEGLPASEGEAWRRQRRMMQPHFHNTVIAKLTERMQALAAASS